MNHTLAHIHVPVLMITFNRLDYTKKSLPALVNCPGVRVHVIDNGSTDGTPAWILDQPFKNKIHFTAFDQNLGIAGAMNEFLKVTTGHPFCGKVDNDTMVSGTWALDLMEKCLDHQIDIIQARHPIPESVAHGATFDEWVASMRSEKYDQSIRYHHFVGGSGILFKRKMILRIPETEWKLYGWRQFQKENPNLKKAFCTDVSVDLLDAHGYSDYPEYYKQTGRVK